MFIIYDTGERLQINLHGQGRESLVYLRDNKVALNGTFIGLHSQTNVFIVNDSSDVISFKWSPFENSEEESLANDLLVGTFNNACDFKSILKRKLITWVKKFSDQQIPYPTNIQTIECSPFHIEPIEGCIQPYTTKEFIVHFNPEKVNLYEDIFYCNIDGVQKCLNLFMNGEGLGPKIKFSYKYLNMGKIFIGSKHKYELVISNCGLIETMFSIHCKNRHTTGDVPSEVDDENPPPPPPPHHHHHHQNITQFSKYFHLIPDEGLICPGNYQVIQIEFNCNDYIGEFNEIFQFSFDGSSNYEEITFSGTVVGPTFHFDVPSVEFDQVSYGFSKEKIITLHNTSFIPMDFILRITGDDDDDEVNSDTNNKQDEQLNAISNHSSNVLQSLDNASFQIIPEYGNLLPMSSMNISIRFSPKYLGLKKYKLIVDVVNVGKNAHWLPISTVAIRPDVIVTPESINLKRCFINHPYTIEMTLTNQSIEPASYQFVEQLATVKVVKTITTQIITNQEGDSSEDSKLQYWIDKPEGFINGLNSVQLSITFKAKVLGLITSELCFKICGINENPLKIPVKCMGEGPVLHVDQTKLEWGTIPVLQPIVKILRISNESCIDANYTAKMVRNDTVYKAEPSSGSIPGYGHVDLNIIANLDDIILFKDQLVVQVENTLQPLKIELSATGQGGTIVTQPSMGSVLNLGCQFSVNPMRKHFKVINKGRRSQQIIWSIDGQSPRKSIHMDGQLSDKSESRWSITPHRFDLNPGASTEICLEVQCDSAKTIHEKILCHSIIGRSAKYLIKTTDVSIDFIKPIIELSTSELFYRIEKAPSDELSTQFNHFTMTNKVDLLLTCLLEVCSPFNLLIDEVYTSTTTFQIKPFESKEITVSFNPKYKDDLISRRADELLFIKYAEHPQTDAVRLIGEVHFPNLQFGSNIIDFGCILNHTEMTEHLSMKNISPLPVKFRWSLLIGDRPNIIFKRQARLTERQLPINVQKLAHADITDGKNTENNLQDICKYTEETEHEISTNEQHNEFNQTLPIFEINKPTDEHIPDDNLNPNLSSPENSILHNLIEEDEDIVPLGIEELFDIVPLYGEINPGETISLSCTFYGHSNIDASVLALCEIDGGPEYKIEIKGSASEINFQLDQTDIDLGYNRLDKPMIYEFNILNTGKVHFEYTIHFHSNLSSNNDHIQQTTLSKLTQYGQFDIKPYYGQINGYQSQSIQITFIPFKPGYFEQELNVQIAYFLPKLIKLHGITDYAHLNLNLPRVCMIQLNNQQFNNDQLSISHYNDPTVYQFTMSKLLDHLYHEVIGLIDLWEKQQQQNIPIVCLCHTIFSDPSQRVLASVKSTNLDRIFMHDINCPIMKAIKQFLSNHYEVMNNFPPQILKLIPDLNLQLDAEREYICNLLNSIEGNGLNFENDVTETEERKRPCFVKNLYLPSYLLDFGIVIIGSIVKQTISIINTSYEPISFRFDTSSLSKAKQFGFSTNITKIHHLPGYPDCEQLDVEISFDTKQISQLVNENFIQTELMIKILNGPSIPILLQANIVKPTLTSHINTVDFGEVQRGEARIITVQLHNPSPVSINWYRLAPELQTNKNTTDSIYPIRTHYKSCQNLLKEKQMRIFEIITNRGILEPNEKTNIQIRFIPLEEKKYETKILLGIENSDTILKIHCQGKGLEPQLIFDRVMLQFQPILPYSSIGSEEIVTVTNPCDYAIEFYSIELDKQFVQEDEILGFIDGYDEYGRLLLPPRKPGGVLPSEVIAYYEEQNKIANPKLSDELEETIPLENSDEKNVKGLKFIGVSSSSTSLKEMKKSSTTTSNTTPTNHTTSTSTSERNKSDNRNILSHLILNEIKHEDSKQSNLNIFNNGKQTLDVTPVSLAISRHLGMDLTHESYKSNKFGIVILVNGALESIRHDIVKGLANKYQAIVLNLNQIIIEALLTSTTDTAYQARQICLNAGLEIIQSKLYIKQKELQEYELEQYQLQQLQLNDLEIKLDSPVELSDDTQKDEVDLSTASISGEQSKVTTGQQHKTSVNRQGQVPHKTMGYRGTLNVPQKLNDAISTTTEYNTTFKSRRITYSIYNDIIKSFIDKSILKSINYEQLYTTILPDHIILQLINEHFNQYHHYINKGIIIDGIESDFTKSSIATIELLLKYFKNNYKYIYTISIKFNYDYYKQSINEQQNQLNESHNLINNQYYEKLLNLTDYDYEELSDHERQLIDNIQFKLRHDKRQIELEQKRIHEEQLREEQEAEAKRIEIEKNMKKKGKRQDEKTIRPITSNQISIKDNRALSGRMSSRPIKDVNNNNLGKLDTVDKSPLTVLEEIRRTSRSHEKHRRSATSFKDEALAEEEVGVCMTEEEHLLCQILKSFEGDFRSICELLSTWNRVTLQQQSSLLESHEDSPTSTIVNLPIGKRTRQSGLNLSSNPVNTNLNKTKHSISKVDPSNIQVVHENINVLLPPIYCDLNMANENQPNNNNNNPVEMKNEKDSTDNDVQIIGIPHLVVEFPFKKDTNIIEAIKQEINLMLTDSDLIHVESIIGTKIKDNLLMTNSSGQQQHQQQQQQNKLSTELCQLLSYHLPELNEIINYLGIGSNGPPIPEPNNFSVIYYPMNKYTTNNYTTYLNRKQMKQSKIIKLNEEKLIQANLKYYEFLNSGYGDPMMMNNILPIRSLSQPTDSMGEEDIEGRTETMESSNKQKIGDSSRRTGGRSIKKERKSPRQKHQTLDQGETTSRKPKVSIGGTNFGNGGARRTSVISIPSEQASLNDEISSIESNQLLIGQPVNHFRWIVPAKGQIRLRIRFRCDQLGQFDQIFNFELLNSRRNYQLYCRGICALPTISREPRLIYPKRKRTCNQGEIIHGAYLMSTSCFEFGPLLIEKSKDRIQENCYPENVTYFNLVNTSQMDSDIRLNFLNDPDEECYSVEPKELNLKPNQSTSIQICAFPKFNKRYDDALVCLIKDNPEPILLKLACDGVLPELELDKKVFNFEKVLLQRKEVRSIILKNRTLLPAQWKLSGIEALGDEFSVSQDAGIVEPQSESIVYAYFRAMKSVKPNQKRSLRLEVYDLENIAGLIQVETIQVIAEAYDVALDITFPKGSDGGIDFGLIKVGEEVRHTITLKNKGPYEIVTNFIFTKNDKFKTDFSSIFTMSPQRINLSPTDKLTQVNLTCLTQSELILKEEEILKCQIIEPNIKGTPQLIASIPIKLSVKAEFSKFTISPAHDINFGSLILNNHKTRQLIIENNGDYEFRYSIIPISKMLELLATREALMNKEYTGTVKHKMLDPTMLSSSQSRLQQGFFTLSPASGIVPPGNAQIITVDCLASSLGQCLEELTIEISDRDMKLYPHGIPYHLKAEGDLPSIETNDPSIIFEEHHVCKNLSVLDLPGLSDTISSGSIYGIEENRFVYRNVLVGSRVVARFRIANRSNVPAEVSFEVSAGGIISSNQPSGRSSSRSSQSTSCDSFEVIPDKALIEPHSSSYANVTFCPTSMQIYTATFNVYIDNKISPSTIVTSGRGSASSSTKRSSNPPVLTFELYGEGNLPQISVLQPKLRNRAGQTLCVFKRIQVGKISSQILSLQNNGLLNSRLNIDLIDPEGVFSLKPQSNNGSLQFYNPPNNSTDCTSESNDNDEFTITKQSYLIGLLLKPKQQFNLLITYQPNKRNIKNYGQIQLMIINNEYEDTLIELIGESLNDEVCIDNIPQLDDEKYICIQNSLKRIISASKTTLDDIDYDSNQDEIQTTSALQHNHLDFGDCGPNETITRTITISHCGKVKETEPTSFRFSWPTNNPILQFRPSEGHLHVNQSRRIEVTFKPSGSPITLKSQCIKCNLHRIVVPVPEDCTKAVDWDDTKQVIRWVDVPGEKMNGPDSSNRSMPTTTTTTTTTTTGTVNSLKPTNQLQTTTIINSDNLQERNIPMNCNYGSSNEVICRKQKLIEIEPEPHYEELLNQPDPKPLELFISAVADFVQFRCDLNRIDFKETSIFEKRIYRFELFNQGLITLHFKWSIHMISSMPENESNKNMITNEYQSNNENHNEHWDKSLIPFKVYPIEDCILPGRSQFIEVTFSPLLLGEFEAQLISKIDNLAQQSSNTNRNRPILTAPIITITGKSENSILHFDLYDSDYISSGRRNLELPGPNGTPFGGSLDPFTRVIEFSTIGLGLKSTRYFSIVNTTREDFEFMIINEDSVNVKQPQSVKCLVEKGIILAGKKVNIGFEYISYQLGLIESFWRFVVDKYDYSVPLLVVGNTREPNILFDQSHINFNAVLIGHQVSKTVLLINQEASTSISSTTFNDISMNNEEQSSNILEFEFLKSSLHSAGKQDSIIVEPMSGHIPPGTKLPIQITFQANGERETNINLQCLIKHRQLPLTLNVKAQGYTIHSSLWIDSIQPNNHSNDNNHSIKNISTSIELIELTPLWSPCIGTDLTDLMNKSIHRIQHDPYLTKKLPKLNFGELYPGECITRKLILYNNGKFKFDFIYQFMLLGNHDRDQNQNNEIKKHNKQQLIDRLINGFITGDSVQQSSLEITPNTGSILPNEKITCTIKFQPLKQLKLLGINRLKLHNLIGICLIIRDGPVYGIKLLGSTKKQTIQFSETCINFGSQLIMQSGLKPSIRYLYISNIDTKQELSIECITQSSKIFSYYLKPTILSKRELATAPPPSLPLPSPPPPPQQQQQQINESNSNLLCLPIYFYPYDNKLYKETIIFEINGSSQYSIDLIGKGCQLLLETKLYPLLIMNKTIKGITKVTQFNDDELDEFNQNGINNNSSKCINLGHLKTGQISRRFISLINKSSASICIHQIHLNQPSPTPPSPPPPQQQQQQHNNNDKKYNSIHVQFCKSINIDKQLKDFGQIKEINTPIIVPSNGGEVMIMLSLTSDYRLPKFIEEVVCEISRVDDNTNNLIQLPKNQINTTTTTTDSQHRNKGEMISIHQENTNMFLPVFSIYGAVNTYDINFNTESINFGSIVRGSQLSKRLVLMNTGDYNAKFEWDKSTLTLDLTIEPMNGSIGPGLEVPFILTLKPNKLTRELRIDNVTCQIQGVGSKLITVSAACVPPTVIKEIQQFSTIVRQQDIKNLQIVNRTNANWQVKPVIDGEQWDGPKIIDIPPQQIGIYELTYKPLTMTLDGAKHKGTIFFPLPDGTGLLYNLCGISDAPKSMMRINREIECKKLHTEVVQIPNWLNASQRFRVLKEILRPDKLDPSTTIQGLDYLDVPADSSKEYKLSIFTYREGFTLIKVTFTNETTGEYQYFEVNFKSIRNKVLDVIRMQTPIRKSITHTLTLENPLSIPVNFQMSTNISEVQCPNQLQIPANCEGKVTLEYLPIKIGQYNGKFEANCNELGSFIYELNLQATQSGFESTLHFRTTIGQRHCQIVDNSDYHCEKQITVAPGVEASLEVAYEPTTVGNSQATLTITSTQAGEYSFLLKGTALLPQPQGPIFIKAGETKHIIFRNVFSTPILYSFQVDNTIFNLPKQSEIIRPGKEFRIPVGLDSNITKSPVTGKLVVTAVRAQSSARTIRKGPSNVISDTTSLSSSSSSSSPQQQQSSFIDSTFTEKGEGLQWVYYLRGITG
uniref:Hydin_ADK domain-containing protein n=1 Tax=Schistosoma mansoni TaxID=6183 RepID=A0A5K4F930_SCHMA